jgi:DNA-binding NarL/FixJ family response regulator
MHQRPYLLIVDETLLAQCLQRLLETEFPGVDILTNARGLLNAVAASQPDLILLDINMSGLSGLDAIRRLREVSPATKVMVVTMNDEPEHVLDALRAGASGYVMKWCGVSELVTAIRGVLNGQSYMTPSLSDRAASAITSRKSRSNGKSLTSRQRQVLQLVAQGRTAKEIANALSLSVKTAVFHKMSIMDKLGLRTTADLTRYALEHGILSTEKSEPQLPSVGIQLASSTSA